jgi:hypothetical protein
MPVLVKDASFFTKEFLKATSFHTYEQVSPKPVLLVASD